MPHTILSIFASAAAALAIALAIKVTLRLRADRRRHACCVFCDGHGGAHASYCQRPNGGRV